MVLRALSGSSRSSWLSKQSSPPTPAHTDAAKEGRRDSDEGSLGSGGHPGDDPGGPRRSPASEPSLKEADSEEADAIEALLQRLQIAENEAPPADPRAETEPKPGSARRASTPCGGQDDAPYADLNALLERDFSVQSLASVVNEDCFFNTAETMERATIPTL